MFFRVHFNKLNKKINPKKLKSIHDFLTHENNKYMYIKSKSGFFVMPTGMLISLTKVVTYF